MSKKMMMLALAAVSAAMFAMPGVASAGEWDLTPVGQTVSLTSEASPENITTLTTKGSADVITCTHTTGSAVFNAGSGKEGHIPSLTFSGCKTGPETVTNCNSAGQAAGVIKTETLKFRNVILDEARTKLGVKLEGVGHDPLVTNSGPIATFTCAFGLVKVEVAGSVIGEIKDRNCSSTGFKTSTIEFASTETGVQRWMQVTETGSKTDLTSRKNGATDVTSSQDGKGVLTSAVSSSVDCT